MRDRRAGWLLAGAISCDFFLNISNRIVIWLKYWKDLMFANLMLVRNFVVYAVAIVISSASVVRADTLLVSAGFSPVAETSPFGNFPNNGYSVIPMFNPALGTLNSVDVLVGMAGFSGDYSLMPPYFDPSNPVITIDVGGSEQLEYLFSTSSGIEITGGLTSFAIDPTSFPLVSSAEPPANPDASVEIGRFEYDGFDDLSLDGSVPADSLFVGTSGIYFSAGVFDNVNLVPNEGFHSAGNPLALGSINVTYTYTPNSVPEPSSFALMGLGGLSLAVGVYRRQRAVAPSVR